MKRPYRYYCLDRPPMPGTVPRGMTSLEDFREFRRVDEIDACACGYVEYDRELKASEIRAYKLAAVERKHNCNDDYCEIQEAGECRMKSRA